MMNSQLDAHFKGWLNDISQKWGEKDVEKVVPELGGVGKEDEIENRLRCYPQLGQLLSTTPLDLQQFTVIAGDCWALDGRFNRTRFTQFIHDGDLAVKAIQRLIDKFPGEDYLTKQRIDNFVGEAVNLGYKDKKGNADRSGAALLASVILTALYPQRFVDYRQSRWHGLAQTLHYDFWPAGASYGEQLIWAGQFAEELSRTETFRCYWPETHALWIIAGICWVGPNPEKPKTELPPLESFPEGDKKQRWHEYRERSSKVIQLAKQEAARRDPQLRCEACEFSFAECYGELGQHFIEAHHKVPIATLKPGSRTRVEDIAFLCANCHRMIHAGERILSVDELKAIIHKQRASLTTKLFQEAF